MILVLSTQEYMIYTDIKRKKESQNITSLKMQITNTKMNLTKIIMIISLSLPLFTCDNNLLTVESRPITEIEKDHPIAAKDIFYFFIDSSIQSQQMLFDSGF
jgi:hypothetical protein